MIKKRNLLRDCLFCIVILLVVPGNSTWAEAVSREAEKYMNRGMAAVETANSPDDYKSAIKEFEQAVRLAPRWPAPYFNLGYLHNKVGKYQEALNSYRKYLVLVPNAPDAAQVQKEIDQIEYRLEKVSGAAKIRSWLEGEWSMTTMLQASRSCWPITFIVNGDSIEAYMPITRSMGHDDKYTDYRTISIKQDVRKIQFNVVLKQVYLERGVLELMQTVNAQYTLNLITFGEMIGTQVFRSFSYNSDGSIWKDKNGTEKVQFNKGKHSDNGCLKSLMR